MSCVASKKSTGYPFFIVPGVRSARAGLVTATTPKKIKRFYEDVTVHQSGDFWHVLLDGKARVSFKGETGENRTPAWRVHVFFSECRSSSVPGNDRICFWHIFQSLPFWFAASCPGLQRRRDLLDTCFIYGCGSKIRTQAKTKTCGLVV